MHAWSSSAFCPSRFAEETGEVREVKAWEEKSRHTLFDESCPICYIITVQALREGWDCSFAYILCSVAELGTQTGVEQILGRVLRMPKATLKKTSRILTPPTRLSRHTASSGLLRQSRV